MYLVEMVVKPPYEKCRPAVPEDEDDTTGLVFIAVDPEQVPYCSRTCYVVATL